MGALARQGLLGQKGKRTMGYRAIAWAWAVQGIGPSERLILIALADSASNADGTCWPGLDLIASMTGYTKRTVISTINSLANRQLISVVERRDEYGRQRSNFYRLSLQSEIPSPYHEDDDNLPLESDALRVKLAHEPGEIDDTPPSPPRIDEPSEEEPSLGSEEPRAAAAVAAKPSGSGSDLVRALAKGHEDVIGLTTPYVAQQFALFVEEYPSFPVAWVTDAFAKAGDNNVRKWAYVRSILEGWATNGRDDRAPRPETNSHGATLDEWQRLPREARVPRGPLVEKLKREGKWT